MSPDRNIEAEASLAAPAGLREALLRIEGWSRFPKGLTRPGVTRTIGLIHDEAVRALEAAPRSPEPDVCSWCGTSIAEHPDTDACALAAEPAGQGLDAAWARAEAAVRAAHDHFDLGLRRYPDGTGYAWASGLGGEPPFLLEVHYPGEDGPTPAAALNALAARLASREEGERP